MVFNIGEYSEEVAYRCAKDLSQFVCLTSLKMEGWYEHLSSLEEILKYCPHLQELSLNIHEESDDVLEPPAVMDWATSTIEERQYNLKNLSIQSSCPADYLEYLFYKYPNIESISIDIELDGDYIEINMDRIMRLIKDVPRKHISFTVAAELDFREIVQGLKAYSYSILIDNVLENGDFQLILAPMM